MLARLRATLTAALDTGEHQHLSDYRAFFTIFILNTLCFIAECIHPSFMIDWSLKSQDWGTLLGVAEVITSMFTHANFGHYFYNMLIVMPFALYLENRAGSAKFFAFWLLSGIGAAVGFAYTPHVMPIWACLGASGACFGVIGAACWLIDEHPVLRALALFVLCAMVWPNYYMTVISLVIPTGIASAAHLFGAATGVILANENGK